MVREICQDAREASFKLMAMDQKSINLLLMAIADELNLCSQSILEANTRDLEKAKNEGMEPVMCDRLLLTDERLRSIASSVRDIAGMASPYEGDKVLWTLENGLVVEKRRVPFGVVGMIYESRPNVTVDAAVIAIKTGNAIVLKGGKEALETNRALVKVMRCVLVARQLPAGLVGFIDTVDRTAAAELLGMKGLIDVMIPRGSASLIHWVCEHAKVPVIETGAGNCHIYVDRLSDFKVALEVIENAKVQRPSVCNAVEKLLVHEAIAEEFLPMLEKALKDRVSFNVDERAMSLLKGATPMLPEEFGAEYLDYILGVRVVDSLEEAVSWINRYSTHHSECIITEDEGAADYFHKFIDSAVVYHNASTRFTDGAEFGFGAEIGISTSKLHARGPMGLEAMTTYKYCVKGSGQIR